MKEKKDLATLEAFCSLSFFSFSSCLTRAFPSPIKGEAWRPMKVEIGTGDRDLDTRARHEHTPERQVSSQHPFTPSTRDLGSSLSRLFVTPNTKQVPVTRATANWMYGCSAQTSINHCILLAHHPSQTRKYKFTRRWSENTNTKLGSSSFILLVSAPT